MTMRRFATIFAAATFAAVLTGCPRDKADEPMTSAEAAEAMDESNVESQASALTSSSVEISTNFQIGKAVQAAAEDLRTFIGSQLPCAEITLIDATLTVKYGAKPGTCVYKGHTFSGTHIVKVSRNDDNDVLVDHEWQDFSNGKVKVNGTANVTWDLTEKERRVVHKLTWTRLSDGRQGHGEGDVTWSVLPGGLREGVAVSGTRSWTGKNGRWDLAVKGVEVRWQDPVPQAGTFSLASPKGRSLELSFNRVDEDTIRVTISSGRRSFSFNVNSIGNSQSLGGGDA
jgi:hypothetical protein